MFLGIAKTLVLKEQVCDIEHNQVVRVHNASNVKWFRMLPKNCFKVRKNALPG